jgi:Late exocytosis, associated with Golgi transport
MQIFAIFAVYGLAVIVPANIAGGLKSSANLKTKINSFNQLSMSNIQHYDSKVRAQSVTYSYLAVHSSCASIS